MCFAWREKNLQKRFTEFLSWFGSVGIFPSKKNANKTHFTNPQMKHKICLYNKTSFVHSDILQCPPRKLVIKK